MWGRDLFLATIQLFLLLFMCRENNDDEVIGSHNDARNAVLEEGASNQDWQAIIARIQEELSLSNFGHRPMEADPNWMAR